MKSAITAADIVNLLSIKHHNDVFVPECKVNSTWGAGHTYRLDAWAMRRSWSPWTTFGYEIKVSRSDFVHDNKWRNYLPICHRFSFVCPRGLIDPKEVGDGAGLIWVTKNGKRVMVKVKAPYREIEPPVELLIYVLMSRTEIVHSTYKKPDTNRADAIAYWRDWLSRKDEARSLGYAVSEAIATRVYNAEAAVKKTQDAVERIEKLDTILRARLGIGVDGLSSWRMEEQIDEVMQLLPASLINRARGAAQELNRFADTVRDEQKRLSDMQRKGVDDANGGGR